jgi:hypothetical protein
MRSGTGGKSPFGAMSILICTGTGFFTRSLA